MTPGTHLPAADSSCAICLPGTSCTQPTLGDDQGREGKKKEGKKKYVCVLYFVVFVVVGFCLFFWPCCVGLIASTLLAGMVALPLLFVLYTVNS